MNDCIRSCMTGEGGECIHPLPLLLWNRRQFEQPKKTGLGSFRASSLSTCTRKAVLEREYPPWDEVWDPADRYRMDKGSIFHEGAENLLNTEHRNNDLPTPRLDTEVKMAVEIDGLEVTGTVDARWINPDTGNWRIGDYKFIGRSTAAMRRAYDNHSRQARFYAAMTEMTTGIPAERCTIEYFGGEDYKRLDVDTQGAREELQAVVDEINTYKATGELPPVLPSLMTTGKRGPVVLRRHQACDWCHMREVCDDLAEQGK